MSHSENMQWFYSFADMREAHANLLRSRRSGGLSTELLVQIRSFLGQAVAAGFYLEDYQERQGAQGMLDYWAHVLERAGEEDIDPLLESFDPERAPELDDSQRPFVGLYAFQENEKNIFFGRQRLLTKFLEHLQTNRLLAVVGPSGSGKSSAIMASLIPKLREDTIHGSANWHYFPRFVPGSRPLLSLAQAIAAEPNDGEWVHEQVARFQQDKAHLANLVVENQGQACLIFIDQFEELFTLNSNDEEIAAFINNVTYFVEDERYGHSVIITMRTDFEPFVARLTDFYPLFEKARVRIMPLNAAELRDAIEKPAELIGLKFEAGVVDELVHDLLGEPAGLPLLQFTLLRLWDKREKNRVTLAAYRELGGGRRALANSADEFFDNLFKEDQEVVKQIFLRLVQPTDGLEVTNRRIQRSELDFIGVPEHSIEHVLEKLVEARLVRLTKKGTNDAQVEVAHEALIRNWPRLVDWLADERVKIRRRLRVTQAAEAWRVLDRDPSALLRGALLIEAAQFGDLNALESEFVAASQGAEKLAMEEELAQERALSAERARSARRLWVGIALLSILVLVTLFLFGSARSSETTAQTSLATSEARGIDLQQALNAQAASNLDLQRSLAARVTAEADNESLNRALETREALVIQLQNALQQSGSEATKEIPGVATATPAVTTPMATATSMVVQTVQALEAQLEEVRLAQTAVAEELGTVHTLGTSVNGQPISATKLGNGSTELVFVGGIHSGLAPNSVKLAEDMIRHFQENPDDIPSDVTLFVIPNANPDSQLATGQIAGRFNANGVDINRNWDCLWTKDPIVAGVRRANTGGERPFSEPETVALRDFFIEVQPELVVFWDGPATGGIVAPSGCEVLNERSLELARVYGGSVRYPVDQSFKTEGDVTNWLDLQGIPAMFILLPDVVNDQWEQNQEGITAVLDLYR